MLTLIIKMLFEIIICFLALVMEKIIWLFETLFIIVIVILLIIFGMPNEYLKKFVLVYDMWLKSFIRDNLLSSEDQITYLDIRILFILLYNLNSKFQLF